MKSIQTAGLFLLAASILAGCSGSGKSAKSVKSADSASIPSVETISQSHAGEEQALSIEEEQVEVKEEANKEQPEPDRSPEPDRTEEESTPAEEPQAAAEDGIRPEFKEAVDSYEQFYTQYADFMKRYAANPSDLNLILEMTSWISDAEEMDDKWEALEEQEGEWSAAELRYFTDATIRIEKLNLEIISAMS